MLNTLSRVVVAGASAGGIEALGQFLSRLPADFPAAVFVVLHVPENGTSLLPHILARAARMKVQPAYDGEPVVDGVVSVAPPGYHLVLQRGTMHLTEDSKEHGFRPSIDILFRSAALAYGSRALGVVFSGLLDDGTSGCISLKKRGGLVAVQSPEDALFPSMPKSVLEHVEVDLIASAATLGDGVSRLLDQHNASAEYAMELNEGVGRGKLEGTNIPSDPPSALTCPECHGALWRRQEGRAYSMFECHTGHRYSARSLAAEQALELEKTLRDAHRSAKERVLLSRLLAERAREKNNEALAMSLAARAEVESERARHILEAIHASPFHGPERRARRQWSAFVGDDFDDASMDQDVANGEPETAPRVRKAGASSGRRHSEHDSSGSIEAPSNDEPV